MTPRSGVTETIAAASGGASAAVAGVTAACCTGPALAPAIVAVLGAGGAAWAAGLRPWSPVLLAVSAGLLAFAFVSTRRAACRPAGWVRVTLWISAGVWFVSAILVAATW